MTREEQIATEVAVRGAWARGYAAGLRAAAEAPGVRRRTVREFLDIANQAEHAAYAPTATRAPESDEKR